MSKVDALKALREARYAAQQAQASAAPVRKQAPASAAPGLVAKKVPAAPAPAPEVAAEADGRCGHRNMGNKSCQRPAGHSEKSHRYK